MGAPKALPGEVNGRYHDGPAVLSPDGRTLYFTRSDYQRFRLNKDYESVSHLKLFQATLANGEWTSIEPFAHNGEEFSTGHAAISRDGNTIYFISDRAGGFGGTDIYSSTRSEEGWSKPINLGATINSAGNEMFPTFHGDTLYFSSNGHAGLGGLDIFKTWKNEEGWTVPTNVNAPLNSTFDDLSLIFNEDGISGYLSSDRTGSDAIHSFVMNDPVFAMKGICINNIDGSPMPGVPVKVTNKTTGEVIELITDDAGYFDMDLDPGQDFLVHVSMDDMFTETADVSTLGQRVSKTFELKMNMRPIEVDKPIVVNNIYYDYDKWDIRPDAAMELLKLARIFKDNPGLSFELSSHTDSRASHLYNLVLSEARAKSAVDFLIRNGVDPDRIVARGYGELQPINNCRDGVECPEELHQQNRRTEFKVIRSETAHTR